MKTFIVKYRAGDNTDIEAYDVEQKDGHYRFFKEPDDNNAMGDTVALIPSELVKIVVLKKGL